MITPGGQIHCEASSTQGIIISEAQLDQSAEIVAHFSKNIARVCNRKHLYTSYLSFACSFAVILLVREYAWQPKPKTAPGMNILRLNLRAWPASGLFEAYLDIRITHINKVLPSMV